MRIQTIHRNQMGDVLNECSAQGFQITTADGGRITIMVDGDGRARGFSASAPAAAQVDVRGLVALAEQMERDAAGCRRDGYIDAAVVKEDCAQRIRQTLGISAIAEALSQQPAPSALVGAEDIEVLKRLRAALHDAPMNGWWLGVEVLDRVIAALEAQHQEPKP